MDFKHGQHLQQNREAVQHGDIRELLANLMTRMDYMEAWMLAHQRVNLDDRANTQQIQKLLVEVGKLLMNAEEE